MRCLLRRSANFSESFRRYSVCLESASAPIPVLLRIEFTAMDTFEPSGELLPRLSTLTDKTHGTTSLATVCSDILSAVFLCCTFPEVAFGGRYPLSLPCGARTFLINGLSACSRDCLSYSRVLFYPKAGKMSTVGKIWSRFFEKFPLCVALPMVLPYNELYLQKLPLGEKWTGKGGRPATACSQALLLSGE